jgi:hypothetical protein
MFQNTVKSLSGQNLHTPRGMLGYCLKEAGQPHSIIVMSNDVTDEDIAVGRELYLVYGNIMNSANAGRKGKQPGKLSASNIMAKMHTFRYANNVPEDMGINAILLRMLSTGYFFPDWTWVMGHRGAVNVERANALLRLNNITEWAPPLMDDIDLVFFNVKCHGAYTVADAEYRWSPDPRVAQARAARAANVTTPDGALARAIAAAAELRTRAAGASNAAPGTGANAGDTTPASLAAAPVTATPATAGATGVAPRDLWEEGGPSQLPWSSNPPPPPLPAPALPPAAAAGTAAPTDVPVPARLAAAAARHQYFVAAAIAAAGGSAEDLERQRAIYEANMNRARSDALRGDTRGNHVLRLGPGETLRLLFHLGNSGSGKSRYVQEHYPDAYRLRHGNGGSANWFSHYNNELTIVIQEANGQHDLNMMKELCDIYPYSGQVKGVDDVPILAKTIVFTSCKHPLEWYKGKDPHGEWERRVREFGTIYQHADPPPITREIPVVYVAPWWAPAPAPTLVEGEQQQ